MFLSFWSTSLIRFWESLKNFIIIIAKSALLFLLSIQFLEVGNDEKKD